MNHARMMIAVGCGLALLGSVAAGAAATHKIGQKGKRFSESEITITTGDTIIFNNNDDVKHNIVIAKMRFNTGIQEPGGADELVFSKAGTYSVRCGLHPKMKLIVNVQ